MDLTAHPCFDNAARLKYGRVHLPVAPGCNVQCNFCDRRFDCANESRPGVTSVLLSPKQAADYTADVLQQHPAIKVVGIAGPGDPLAQAEKTLRTLQLVRQAHPDVLLCVATNGLALEQHVDALLELAVSHVTVTVCAVDPEIGAQIYAWVRDGNTLLKGRDAAARMWEAQQAGIQALHRAGIMIKINSIMVPGVNDHHLPEVARAVAALGAQRFNCLPMRPVDGTPLASLGEPETALVHRVRAECAQHLQQMEHCQRCRADAVGRLGHTPSPEQLVLLRTHATHPATERPYVAVASQEGVLVNQHLGEAEHFWIFAHQGDGYVQVDRRAAPVAGAGTERWTQVAQLLADCRALLVQAAGDSPRRILYAAQLTTHVTEGLIEDALDALYQGRPLPRKPETTFRCGKGATCGGDGLGCGG